MVHPKGCGRFGQAAPDTILDHPDHLFYLPIGLTVANGDVLMYNSQPFTEPYKAACKVSTIVGPDVTRLAPTDNQIIIQKLGLPSNYAVRAQRGFLPT